MKIVGVTGSFGSGKTTVARLFQKLGAIVIDADARAHEAISRKGPAYKKVLKIFGREILKSNKEIDRKRLGRIVFSDRALLRKLNAAVHPVVIKDIRERVIKLKRRSDDKLIVLDAPLLVEAGMAASVGKLIVVKARREDQIKRCVRSAGLSKKEVLASIRAQAPITEKIRFADFVIDNGGTVAETERKVKKIWEKLQ